MAINFPDSPSVNDTHTVGDKTWVWDGTVWSVVVAQQITDHGNLQGLADDDHTQYLLADGTRSATELDVTGDLTVDTDTLHVDSTNNWVGIGTASPSYNFHVKNDSSINAAIESTIANVFVGLKGTGETAFDKVGIGTNGSNGMELHAGDEARLVIDSSGNVGIGTTSPSASLDINKSGDPVLRVTGTDSNDTASLQLLEGATDPATYGLEIKYDGDVNITKIGHYNASTTVRTDIEITRAGGYVTMPNQPAFRARAYYTDSSPSYSGQSTAYFYDVNLNNGGHFTTSGTGAYQRFVAPVSGYYAFHLSWVVYQATSGNYYGFQFRKNNVEMEPHHYYKQSSAGNDDGTSMSIVEYCAANDYVTCVTNFQNSEKIQVGVFTGHLIG